MAKPTQVTFTNSGVASIFARHPPAIFAKHLQLCQLVFETDSKLGLYDIEETLECGESSYISNNRCTFRIACKASQASQIALTHHKLKRFYLRGV